MTEYINTPGNEVPENTIVVVPYNLNTDGFYTEIIEPLNGKVKRDWFTDHFYYCLPLVIGNQYGFIIKSTRKFSITWPGGNAAVKITEDSDNLVHKQSILNHFTNGVLTVQNHFALKTPIGINLMTIQPPNFYIPGLVAMSGVIETDNIRRDFTFNLRVTIPDMEIEINIGDPLGAFIPVPRGTVENYKLKLITDIFSQEQHALEVEETNALSKERFGPDKGKPHMAGRRYFNGKHTNNDDYLSHQKVLKKTR